MPYNLFLIVTITGYFILTYSQLFKYNIQRFSRERILFESILAGFLIVVGGFIFRIIFDFITCGKVIPILLEFLNKLPIEKPLYFWTFIFSSIISILLAWFTNWVIIKYYPKNDQIVRAVNKNGDEIEKLFKDSAINGYLIQVTLKNEKVYVGFCEEIPIPKKTNYLKLSPYLSGYRNKDTKQLTITTDYEKVVDEFITEIKEETGVDVDEITLNTDVIIKQDEILTATIYEQAVFDKFNKPQVESEKPKRGRKPKPKE